ncbi:uncharacterized protein [Macrobrachium rosenbergii]|uniref:uncharacterized protein n=1 Tax=Macrobrachium rosenbergii TaxID=79674 RepID=UPI0034D5E281
MAEKGGLEKKPSSDRKTSVFQNSVSEPAVTGSQEEFLCFRRVVDVIYLSAKMSFTSNRGSATFENDRKKVDLLSLASQLNIEVSHTALKGQILDSILDYYIDEDVFTEEQVVNLRSKQSKVDKELELARIQLRLREVSKEQEDYLSRKRLEEKQKLLDLELEYKVREAELNKKLEEEKAKIAVEKHRQELGISSSQPIRFDLSRARKLPGHTIKNCTKPGCKVANQSSKISSQPTFKKTGLHCAVDQLDYFKEFICHGLLNSKEVSILRDTGAAQSIIHKNLVPDLKFTDEHVVVSDFSSSKVLPLAEVNLDCPYVNETVKVAVTDNEFPVDVGLVLGNDLAGSKVMCNLIICNPESKCNKLEAQSPDHADSICVVTRSKKSTDEQPKNVPSVSVNHSNLPDLLNLSKDNFVKLQQEDGSLSSLFEKAVQKSDIDKVPCYYIENGILMRLFRPSKLSAKESWADCEQVIVPSSLRSKILEIAHCADSHLGVSKTYQRLSCNFYWPRMKNDVKSFVQCCHICQIAGKPNEVIPPAPLKTIAIPHEPFSKVVIDCVGPLPKTRKGNQYLLTVMCPTTRFPIAIPLPNISAKKIIESLIKIFTVLGFPKELQCDRGTNFKSDVFQSVLKELNIKQSFSSAYHPQSQGVLERAHQTMKSLLGKYALESAKDWDENLDLLMFVIRSVPNESIGVSPFEMLFGRKARDVLRVVKENLIGEVEVVTPVTVTKYLQNMKDKFDKIHKFAYDNLKVSQEKMEVNYNKKAKVRKFTVGDNVLVYFPIPGSPLKHKFSGPYKVTKVINKLNYVVSTPDRKKSTQLVHVNLIKPFCKISPVLVNDSVHPCEVSVQPCGGSTKDYDETDMHLDLNTSWTDCSNSDILASLDKYFEHLTSEQRTQLECLLLKYESVCSDTPGNCNIILHDIKLFPNTSPIRQPYYRIVGEKLQLMKREVEYLLNNGLASPSCSPWASYCILVAKPNGKVRMCTDYRRVNSVTQKDSYPLPRILDILDNIVQRSSIWHV